MKRECSDASLASSPCQQLYHCQSTASRQFLCSKLRAPNPPGFKPACSSGRRTTMGQPGPTNQQADEPTLLCPPARYCQLRPHPLALTAGAKFQAAEMYGEAKDGFLKASQCKIKCTKPGESPRPPRPLTHPVAMHFSSALLCGKTAGVGLPVCRKTARRGKQPHT